MKALITIVIIAVAGVLGFIFLQGGEDNQITKETGELKVGTKIGNLAPDFELVDYNGRKISLGDFRGQPVFLNFWASWCPFCLDEMPLMADVQEEFGDKFVTIGVNRGENLETSRDFSDRVGVTGRFILLLDEKDKLFREYGGFAMPYSIFIDADGVIRDIKLGPLMRRELISKLNTIIK